MSTKTKEPFKVGIAGLGTVGVGVVKILETNQDLIAKRVGRPIEIISVTASSKDKDRGIDLSSYEWIDTIGDMVSDQSLDCFIECIGGSEGAVKEAVETALGNSLHVVTANKALVAHHGVHLAQLAKKNGVTLAYEAAIAGGIPIVKTLKEGLAANNIHKVFGILNGTCNYILTNMEKTGRDFSEVLTEAQEKGYAEADPSFDVDGIDAAHKLALLGALAFGVEPDFEALSIEGIRQISAADISVAKEMGYRIKLLGITKMQDGMYMESVEPCFVPLESAIAGIDDVFNAVLTEGDFVGQTLMQGRGAGQGPTASSIVADIIDLAKGYHPEPFGKPVDQLQSVQWRDNNEISTSCYVRLKVKDETGVIAQITDKLGHSDVSIDSFIQRGHEDDGSASVFILTHETVFSNARNALKAVEELDCVIDKPLLLRIEKI
ncbi:MAG: homoserine dehydrogenase [Pseudomonadota bacterium]